MTEFATIPMQWVGPIAIKGQELSADISVPLATYETPLWPSVNRGARISQHCDGIHTLITDERMSRSIAVEATSAALAQTAIQTILKRQPELDAVVSKTSRFAKLININPKQIGKIVYLRLEYTTGDASGHNMTTLASEHIQRWVLAQFPQLKYVAVSGNMCTDKKVSSINNTCGRGKSVIAEITVSQKKCKRFLKVTPKQIVELNIKKNLLGSIAAGSLHSANAHYANMLLAFYLATGQDAANIVEGSQGITHAELTDNGDLYFSVNLPNIIVGSIGNGKDLAFVKNNLEKMGLNEQQAPGINARKLAIITAATVLCGELSLMGAIANPGELIDSHLAIERQ
jgi:hydroxymethylglutaryl-CoA reductase (NADPH)